MYVMFVSLKIQYIWWNWRVDVYLSFLHFLRTKILNTLYFCLSSPISQFPSTSQPHMILCDFFMSQHNCIAILCYDWINYEFLCRINLCYICLDSDIPWDIALSIWILLHCCKRKVFSENFEFLKVLAYGRGGVRKLTEC